MCRQGSAQEDWVEPGNMGRQEDELPGRSRGIPGSMDAKSRCFLAAWDPRTAALRAVGHRAAPGSTMRTVNCSAQQSAQCMLAQL